jgi:AhpD family alkylhydroperoxidase
LAGALSEKTKKLIALALGVAAHCDGCLGFHAKALVRLGASKAEVEEALAVAVAASTHAVVWIDHHHSIVLHIDASSVQPRQVQEHVHPTVQHGSEVRSEHEFFAKGLR